jgi:hypothetical protein
MDGTNINLDRVKNKLSKINNVSKRDKNLWKPDAGDQKIRVVPYKYDKEFPFVELQWYYDLPGPSIISPASFGNEDPILDFAQELREAGGEENYKLSKKLMPKTRTYAPVVVRGEENLGTRFYGFGVTIFRQLLKWLEDDDFPNFIDPAEGNDIKLTYIPRQQSDTNFPKTEIDLVYRSSPVAEDKSTLNKIFNDQEKIENVFDDKIAEAEELEEKLKQFQKADFDLEKYQAQARGESAPSTSNGSASSGNGSASNDDSQEDAPDADELADELESYLDE